MAEWTEVYDAAGNRVGIAKTADIYRLPPAVAPAPVQAPDVSVVKAAEEQRYLLGLAYQAGPDPRIARGADGGRDFFTADELEKAAWSFMRTGPHVGTFHADGTEGAAAPVESFLWRWPDWDCGDGIVVKSGDWLIGSILDPPAWDLYKRGLVTGYSPQGSARRLATR